MVVFLWAWPLAGVDLDLLGVGVAERGADVKIFTFWGSVVGIVLDFLGGE